MKPKVLRKVKFMKVLLSIKPEFVEQIMKGTKKYEYRKRIFKQDVDSVVIYSTMPVGRIVGEFKIESILKQSPDEIWRQTYKYSGISEHYFREYFVNHDEGYAIKIKELLSYDEPLNPHDLFSDFVAPQSFMYLRDVDSKAV